MATSRFCWGAHDPPTVKALRTLATHIVGYPWNATALPLRDWGSTVLYLGLEAPRARAAVLGGGRAG